MRSDCSPQARAAGQAARAGRFNATWSGHSGPACVSACPTGAAVRLSPQRDVLEVSPGRGAEPKRPSADSVRPAFTKLLWWFLLPPLVALTRWSASSLPGFRLLSGLLAGAFCFALLAHALVKRQPRIRARLQRWLGGTDRGLSPLVRFHAVAGACIGGARGGARWFSHPGGRAAHSRSSSTLRLSGLFGAIVYACFQLG